LVYSQLESKLTILFYDEHRILYTQVSQFIAHCFQLAAGNFPHDAGESLLIGAHLQVHNGLGLEDGPLSSE
jgi:hypothetical protein